MTTIEFHPISTCPTDKKVLLFWENLDHFEKGIMILRWDDVITHDLLFNKSYGCEPTHWAEIPALKFCKAHP